MMNEPLPDSGDVNERGFNMPDNIARKLPMTCSLWEGLVLGQEPNCLCFRSSSASQEHLDELSSFLCYNCDSSF